ncbi:shikimate kinase [Treponema sp.]|uniref:shikimate kinase n=1 Tax=Treponema sp. TaxID=166 RepID=UPI003FA2D0DA
MNCIILTGIQHSGKTTVGKLTAERIGCDFYDIDALIEKTAGISCRKLFAQQGAESFKQAEWEACLFLKNLLQIRRSDPFLKAVVAAGGGICDNPRALAVLETIGVFIYLHVSEHTAFERICARAKRTGSFPAYIEKRKPANAAERRSVFHEVYMYRTAEYKKKAHVHIDTEGLTPCEVSCALFTAVQITIKK